MASYVFCRVCDERHTTYERALADLTDMVQGERYLTQHRAAPKVMGGTPMIGVGARGGRGLFVTGTCTGLRWEALGEEARPYRHRIDVRWDSAIYRADYDEVFAGVTRYNERSWTSATREDFHLVRARVLAGEIVHRVNGVP